MTVARNTSTTFTEERSIAVPTWERLGALAGIAFAVLFVAGMLLPTTGFQDRTNAEVTAFFEDSGNRATYIIVAYLMALAGVAFLWFLGSLRHALQRAEGASGMLVPVVGMAGAIFVTLLFAGGATTAAIPGGVELGGEPLPSSDLLRMFPQLGHGLILLYAMFAASVLIVAASIVMLKSSLFPRWLCWTGFVCAVVLLGGVMFMPTIALPIWVIATSIVLLRRAETPAPSRVE